MARRAEIESGTNNVAAASKKRQELAGGDKKTLLLKEIANIENDLEDALHGLVDYNKKNGRKKGHWSINNNGGGPQNLQPGEPWRMLSTRLRFNMPANFKQWFTSDSKKKHLGPQVYKWSSENKTKGLSLKSLSHSTVWKEATLYFEPV